MDKPVLKSCCLPKLFVPTQWTPSRSAFSTRADPSSPAPGATRRPAFTLDHETPVGSAHRRGSRSPRTMHAGFPTHNRRAQSPPRRAARAWYAADRPPGRESSCASVARQTRWPCRASSQAARLTCRPQCPVRLAAVICRPRPHACHRRRTQGSRSSGAFRSGCARIP